MPCYVNPEDKHILSATSADAILLGEADEGNEDNEKYKPCVVYVQRAIYLAAISAWLDRKADYNKRYKGDWCGVGNIIFHAARIDGGDCHIAKHLVTSVFDGALDELEEFVNISAYRATEYEIDMEHG